MDTFLSELNVHSPANNCITKFNGPIWNALRKPFRGTFISTGQEVEVKENWAIHRFIKQRSGWDSVTIRDTIAKNHGSKL